MTDDKNKYILELTKELNKYRDKETFVKYLLRIPVKYNTPITPLYSDANEYTNTLVIFLSDMHIGAYNPKYGFIQLEDYNKEEISRRLDKVYNFYSNGTISKATVKIKYDLAEITEQGLSEDNLTLYLYQFLYFFLLSLQILLRDF